MKKTILSVSILFLCLMSFANAISKGAAEQIAAQYLGTTNVSYVSAPSAAFHIFSADGKWVAISSCSSDNPVIAHGDGDINAVPSAMLACLTKAEDSKGTTTATQTRGAGTQTLLTTASWGLGTPYNGACPEYPASSGSFCLTGSAATAMAIVMHHNKWPGTGSSKTPKYNYYIGADKITVNAIDLSKSTYVYSDMPATLTPSSSSAQKTAVTNFIYQCGAMIKTEFTPDTTSRFSTAVAEALSTYMSYSKSAIELHRTNYTNQEWFNKIKDEIDNNRPLICRNGDNSEGYSFVCDGYNSDSEVHINWCCSGKGNGWFAVSSIDAAIFNLIPAEGPQSELYLAFSDTLGKYWSGISLKEGNEIETGESFYVKVGRVFNASGSDYKGKLKICLLSKSGMIRGDVSEETACNIASSSSGFYEIQCKIDDALVLGDRLCAYYQLKSGEWMLLGANQENALTVGALGVFDAAIIDVSSDLYEGNFYYPALAFDHGIPSSLKWYYDEVLLEDGGVRLTSGYHTIKAVITYRAINGEEAATETVLKKIRVNK